MLGQRRLGAFSGSMIVRNGAGGKRQEREAREERRRPAYSGCKPEPDGEAIQ